ncbi:MAG: hypothetical protein V3W41_13355 [Planctomycetota bacterium]
MSAEGDNFLENLSLALRPDSDKDHSQAWAGVRDFIREQCENVLTRGREKVDENRLDDLSSEVFGKLFAGKCRGFHQIQDEKTGDDIDECLSAWASNCIQNGRRMQTKRSQHERDASAIYYRVKTTSASQFDMEKRHGRFLAQLKPFDRFIFQLHCRKMSARKIYKAVGKVCSRQKISKGLKELDKQLDHFMADDDGL